MKKRIELTVLSLLAILALLTIHIYITLYTSSHRSKEPIAVTIPRGTSFNAITNILHNSGVISDRSIFTFAASLKGAKRRIQAGEYDFDEAMSPMDIIDSLVKGRTKQYTFVFKEGYNIKEIAALLSRRGIASERAFIKRARDKNFFSELFT